MNSSRAFFYVDGLPTKGCWVDLDGTKDWDTIRGVYVFRSV